MRCRGTAYIQSVRVAYIYLRTWQSCELSFILLAFSCVCCLPFKVLRCTIASFLALVMKPFWDTSNTVNMNNLFCFWGVFLGQILLVWSSTGLFSVYAVHGQARRVPASALAGWWNLTRDSEERVVYNEKTLTRYSYCSFVDLWGTDHKREKTFAHIRSDFLV